MAERQPLPHDPAHVRAELQRRIASLLPALGVTENPRQGRVFPRNPRRNDRHPGSFVIWTDPAAAGAWRDYAVGDLGGDVFQLIEYLLSLSGWIDAYWWALDWLGWGRGQVRSADQAAVDARRREEERKAAEARAAATAKDKANKAFALWLKCSAEIRGTPAWTYLTEARGLPMQRFKAPPGALRFHPALTHVDRETGEVTEWPALVSAMSHWKTGQVCAVHRTYLAPDGSGKAPVASAKKMLGLAEGCAIRLSKGAGGLTPEEAARRGERAPLVITEGIEDALTAAIAQPDYRVWAAGSLSLMGALQWPACASAVVLGQDNDWDKPQAQEAFDKVLAHWRAGAAGRPVKAVRAAVGKDLNDWARG